MSGRQRVIIGGFGDSAGERKGHAPRRPNLARYKGEDAAAALLAKIQRMEVIDLLRVGVLKDDGWIEHQIGECGHAAAQ